MKRLLVFSLFAFGLISQSLVAYAGIEEAEAICSNRKAGEVPTACVNAIQSLAEQGNARAQYNLGALYTEGRGVIKDDFKGFEWIEKAAKQGLADAQFTLGNVYAIGGQGIRQDYSKAVEWYEKAAQQDRGYQFVLGTKYHLGKVGSKDDLKAKEWYGRACDNKYQRGCEEYAKLNKHP